MVCPANIRTEIAHARRTRPERFSRSGVLDDDGFVEILERVHAQGMDPEHLALHIKRAIEGDELYVIPYPEVRDDLERIFGRILDAVPGEEELSPAGATQRVLALAEFREAARRRAAGHTLS